MLALNERSILLLTKSNLRARWLGRLSLTASHQKCLLYNSDFLLSCVAIQQSLVKSGLSSRLLKLCALSKIKMNSLSLSACQDWTG